MLISKKEKITVKESSKGLKLPGHIPSRPKDGPENDDLPRTGKHFENLKKKLRK